MATNASPFIVNIVPLQNVASDIRGTDATTVLQGQMANLQTMIDTTTHTIFADNFSNFTPSNSFITVDANLNLASNVGLYSNSNLVYLNTTSTVTTTATYTTASGSNTTGGTGNIAVSFTTAFTSAPKVTATYFGNRPVFMSVDTVTTTGFKAYSWSNALSFPNAPFNWNASI